MWIEAFTNNLSFLISVYRRFKDIKKKGHQCPLLVNELRIFFFFLIKQQKATPKQKPTSQPDNNNNSNSNPPSKNNLGF